MAQMHRIVCGVDFGTTYTAVAWTETSNPNHIEIIQNWPTSGQLVGTQVPTEIAYAEGDTTNFSWGYDISPRVKKVVMSARSVTLYANTSRLNGLSSAWTATMMS
jgi:molecular chaperone DnaK (HSP70)